MVKRNRRRTELAYPSRRRLIACGTAVAVLNSWTMLVPQPSMASFTSTSPIYERAERAHGIVWAQCVSVEIREEIDRPIHTTWEFEVLRTVKGDVPISFLSRSSVGRIGRRGAWKSTRTLVMNAGDEAVLFLGPDTHEGTKAIHYDASIVVDPATDARCVIPGFPLGFDLRRASDDSIYHAIPECIPLVDFLYTLEGLFGD